jgi:hypothetical protein
MFVVDSVQKLLDTSSYMNHGAADILDKGERVKVLAE